MAEQWRQDPGGRAALAAVVRTFVLAPALQAAASNLMRQVIDVGLLDPPQRIPYSSYGPERVDTPLHRQLAYEAALQGIVLLQARRWWGRMGGEATLPAAPRPVQGGALSLRRVPMFTPSSPDTAIDRTTRPRRRPTGPRRRCSRSNAPASQGGGSRSSAPTQPRR